MSTFANDILKDKTAVVTGSSRGIGRAIALELASLGANIAVVYYGESETEHANEVKAEIEALGTKAAIYECNVGDFAAAEALTKAVVAEFGAIDILVNNAGITRDGLMPQMTEAQFDAVINTNLKGTFNMLRHVSRQMIRKKSGRIINIASVAGIMGNAGQVNYSASKAGVIGMTKSAAKELASRGITVNAIAPGFVATDMTKDLTDSPLMAQIPMGRMAAPDEIAALAAYLASPAAAYITGEVIRIDGGLAM
ncbi:MAG: 3-oxoacyl-[Clostridia bacterium]|nr:3-oxoacyl-[acyl-carrier-protein] reductase [Clostridia bacterium]